ncbi:MAG: AraC family transcriptional regulator [Bacteroidales bacterium]|nr:AraC family transcriptional regulator [Bacteroidales bacterium]
MKLSIKNMVCNRCIMVVEQTFQEAGVKLDNIQLGSVETSEELNDSAIKRIDEDLKKVGFELINDSKRRLIEQIKTTAIDYAYQNRWDERHNFSDYLVDKLHLDYSYLSSIFSSVEGSSIEKYLINLKIERVKELLVYDEKTLSEIAWELGYSSVAHLSGQFKRVTGFSASHFKQIKEQKRKSINDV